ncbi:MAG TPA: hypothetical protein VGM88_11560 [Kofleriaceae bacterium]|jgi:hypothetical protein
MARVDRALAGARVAYERAHVVAGARGIAVAAALVVLALALHRTTDATWLAAGILASTLGVLGWRGGPMRRGSLAGVLAGLPPMIAPVFVSLASHGGIRCASCPTMPSWTCTLTCFATAALVGLAVGNHATRDASPGRFAFAATITAALTGALGCGTTGIGGALGIVVGLVAGGVTGWVSAARAT